MKNHRYSSLMYCIPPISLFFNIKKATPTERLSAIKHFQNTRKLFGLDAMDCINRLNETLFSRKNKRTGSEEKLFIAINDNEFRYKIYKFLSSEKWNFALIQGVDDINIGYSESPKLKSSNIKLNDLRSILIYEEAYSYSTETKFSSEDSSQTINYLRRKYPNKIPSIQRFVEVYDQMYGDEFYIDESSSPQQIKGLSKSMQSASSYALENGEFDVKDLIDKFYSKYI